MHYEKNPSKSFEIVESEWTTKEIKFYDTYSEPGHCRVIIKYNPFFSPTIPEELFCINNEIKSNSVNVKFNISIESYIKYYYFNYPQFINI